jgi:predicted RNase H-like HicB family nuclease
MEQKGYAIELHQADPDEGQGFWVSVPGLDGCFTQGETYDEAVSRAKEAIQGHLAALEKADNRFRRVRGNRRF